MRFYDAILTSKQLVVGHCSAALKTSSKIRRTLNAGDDDWGILYPMLLILQVHIFVSENAKAIKNNKFTMTW